MFEPKTPFEKKIRSVLEKRRKDIRKGIDISFLTTDEFLEEVKQAYIEETGDETCGYVKEKQIYIRGLNYYADYFLGEMQGRFNKFRSHHLYYNKHNFFLEAFSKENRNIDSKELNKKLKEFLGIDMENIVEVVNVLAEENGVD